MLLSLALLTAAQQRVAPGVPPAQYQGGQQQQMRAPPPPQPGQYQVRLGFDLLSVSGFYMFFFYVCVQLPRVTTFFLEIRFLAHAIQLSLDELYACLPDSVLLHD